MTSHIQGRRIQASRSVLMMAVGCLIALAAALFLVASANSLPDEAHRQPTGQLVDNVLELMNQRLKVMQDVARWKYNQHQAVTDQVREQALLQTLSAQGAEHGLNVDFTRRFFQSQMDVAKSLQQGLIDDWTQQKMPPFANIPDLKTDIRPLISEISGQMLDLLSELSQRRASSDLAATVDQSADTLIDVSGLTGEMRQQLLKPLHELLVAPNSASSSVLAPIP